LWSRLEPTQRRLPDTGRKCVSSGAWQLAIVIRYGAERIDKGPTHSKATGGGPAALPLSPIRYRFLGRQSLGVEPVNTAVPRLPAGDTQSDQKSIRSAQMRSSGLSVAMWFGEQIN